MRIIVVLVAVAALAGPAAALADDPPAGEGTSPAQACKSERTGMGAQAFADLYGTNAKKSNAFGKCVSKKAHAREASHTAAASQCRTEQNDPAFAAAHDGKTFDQFYGTGKGKNAFGKCVSQKAKAANEAQDQATMNAAKQCKRERAADPAAFKTTNGTNKSKSNAFGKCVAKKAKVQQQQP